MKPELIPLYSAALSAVVALLVAWLASNRTIRLEIDKLRLATEQLVFSKLLEVRIREYPKLYAILSDLPKALEEPSTTSVQRETLLSRVNEWDSQYSIFLGPEASNTCWHFRRTLRQALLAAPPSAVLGHDPSTIRELLAAAERLELALRSDLGIHGIGVGGGAHLVSQERKHY